MPDAGQRNAPSRRRSLRTLSLALLLPVLLVAAGCESALSSLQRETATSPGSAVAQQVSGSQGDAASSQPAGPGHPRKRYIVETENAPPAIGPYSQAVGAGDFLFLAGQIPIDPATGEVLRDADIETQTTLVLRNLQAVLEEVGLTMDDIVSTSVFLTDLDDFPVMNAVYATFFGDEPPARATVEVPRLPADVNVEISAIAYTGHPRGKR